MDNVEGLNRLRRGLTCSKEQRQKCRYFEGDATCECVLATENNAHMMQCTLLARPCSLGDLNSFNDIAKQCVWRDGKHKFDDTMMMINLGLEDFYYKIINRKHNHNTHTNKNIHLHIYTYNYSNMHWILDIINRKKINLMCLFNIDTHS